jgi:hypothetical protein
MTMSSAISILPLRILILVAVLCVVGCVVSQPKQSLSFAEVKAFPFFAALVEDVQLNKNHSSDGTDYLAVEIRLRRDDGAKVVITTDRATLTQAAFAQNLVSGRVYKWPQVITDFEAETKLIQRSTLGDIPRALSPAANFCR